MSTLVSSADFTISDTIPDGSAAFLLFILLIDFLTLVNILVKIFIFSLPLPTPILEPLFLPFFVSSSVSSFSFTFLLNIKYWVGGDDFFCQKTGERGVKH